MTSEWHRGWLGRGVGSVYVGPGGWHHPRQQTTQEATPRGATSRGPAARRTPSSSGHLVGKVPCPPCFLFYSARASCRHCMNRLPSLSSVPHWSAQVLSERLLCARHGESPSVMERTSDVLLGCLEWPSQDRTGRTATCQFWRLQIPDHGAGRVFLAFGWPPSHCVLRRPVLCGAKREPWCLLLEGLQSRQTRAPPLRPLLMLLPSLETPPPRAVTSGLRAPTWGLWGTRLLP